MATATQMNIRIDSDLRTRGNRELSRRNLSPSQGVRAFYRCVARGDETTAELFRLLRTDDAVDGQGARKLAKVQEHQAWLREMRAKLGESAPAAAAIEQTPSNRELYIAALEERMRERGTL